MIAVQDLADALGGDVLTVLVDEWRSAVDDLTMAEPGVFGRPGDLVLGVATAGAEEAAGLVRHCAAEGAAAVLVRQSLARRRRVREAAAGNRIALIALADQASWAHVVWLLRGAIDRALRGGRPWSEQPEADDLFALADAAAALAQAPVTIEDARSRVLAYSTRQDASDPTRVSTIIGRRVPEEVLTSYRSRGVFRRLATSAEPFWVPVSPDGAVRGRLVVPVRAGPEWLGSIWVVADAEPPVPVVRELVQTASVVALHLLCLRTQSDLVRRVSHDRLRAALAGADPEAHRWLPPAPWRVVALGPGSGLDLWESRRRRRSWPQPQVVEIEGRDYALVRAEGNPGTRGSWAWLRAGVQDLARDGEPVLAGAGGAVSHPARLAASRAEALETLQTLEAADRTPAESNAVAVAVAVTIEQVWARVTTARAVHGLGAQPVLGPLARLREHDERTGTAYLQTLTAWLDHPGEPGMAARALHVHPNTVRYRMQRMAELVELALPDPEVRLALQLQLRALVVTLDHGAQ